LSAIQINYLLAFQHRPDIKGIVHPKMAPPPQTMWRKFILKNILPLPSFVMALNSIWAPKSTPIHHKSNPYGSKGYMDASWSEAMGFARKISIFI